MLPVPLVGSDRSSQGYNFHSSQVGIPNPTWSLYHNSHWGLQLQCTEYKYHCKLEQFTQLNPNHASNSTQHVRSCPRPYTSLFTPGEEADFWLEHWRKSHLVLILTWTLFGQAYWCKFSVYHRNLKQLNIEEKLTLIGFWLEDFSSKLWTGRRGQQAPQPRQT